MRPSSTMAIRQTSRLRVPGRVFQGKVTRHPDALNQATRTMLVEVELPNRDQLLYPGMYARLTLRVAAPMQCEHRAG